MPSPAQSSQGKFGVACFIREQASRILLGPDAKPSLEHARQVPHGLLRWARAPIDPCSGMGPCKCDVKQTHACKEGKISPGCMSHMHTPLCHAACGLVRSASASWPSGRQQRRWRLWYARCLWRNNPSA
eukprot:scaffold15471_cov20-Tisochrysis_lutea.AAC.3